MSSRSDPRGVRRVNYVLLAARKPRTLSEFQTRRERTLMRWERTLSPGVAAMFRKEGALVKASLGTLQAGARLHADRSLQWPEGENILVRVVQVFQRMRAAKTRLFRTVLKPVLEHFGKRLNGGLLDFGATVDLTLVETRAVAFLDHHVPAMVGDIDTETLRRVATRVRTGIEKGLSHKEVAKSIQQLFTDMTIARAQTIAQTEMGIAASTGDYLAAAASGMELYKIWSNSRDEKVRPSHQIREAVARDDRFSNGLRYPLDPEGPVAEIVNCRCAALFVPPDELNRWVSARPDQLLTVR